MKNLMSGFFKENPVLVLYLGICSALAISTSLNNALGMGVAVIAVLVISNSVISLFRKIIPDEIRIPVYIVIIAALVKACEMLIQAYLPSLYSSLGVFVALIVVNCIILGRAEAFASKNGVFASMLDGLSMGLGYTFTLVLISITRQIIGTGVLSLSNPMTNDLIFEIQIIPVGFEIGLFIQPAGAFITFACFAAAFSVFKGFLERKKGAK